MTKQEIIAKYGRKEGDTGSPEVQIALLTERIQSTLERIKRITTQDAVCFKWLDAERVCLTILNKLILKNTVKSLLI